MDLIWDPVILALFCLTVLCGFVALRPRRRPEVWLLLLTVLLFGLPRAGFVMGQFFLPLPLTHVLAAVFIVEWLLLRKTSVGTHRHLARYFLLYALVAGFGLVLGLSTGGTRLVAFLEISFYFFAMGLFFYTSETFRQRRHFYLFAHLALGISVAVSLYGIAQKFFGSSVLVPYVTYTSFGQDISQISYSIKTRVLSSYGDPNVLASQLVVFVGISMALIVGRGLSSGTRMLGLFILAVNVVCIVFTGSRAGMLCLALVPMIILYWRSKWAILILPVLLGLGILWLPSVVESSLVGKVSSMGPGIMIDPGDLRAEFPSLAWRLLQAVPLGCGWGNTVTMQVTGLNWDFMMRPAEVIWMGFNSFWLNLFSRLGVPGLVTFVLLLVVLFRYVWAHARMVQDAWVRAFLIGALAGFIGQSVIWLVNNTFMLPGGGLNFWFTMGMLVAGCQAFTEPGYPVELMRPMAPMRSIRSVRC